MSCLLAVMTVTVMGAESIFGFFLISPIPLSPTFGLFLIVELEPFECKFGGKLETGGNTEGDEVQKNENIEKKKDASAAAGSSSS